MDNFQSVPALDLYAKLFCYMPPMVIKWSKSSGRFQVQNKSHWWTDWVWCLNIFIFVFLIGFGSCIDVITHRNEAGGSLFVITCLFGSLSFLTWTCAAVLNWNVDKII